MKRLFFAFWPPPTAQASCQELVHQLRCPGRTVSRANLHVTLAFLGAVQTQKIARLREHAAEIDFAGATLRFDQLCFWPKPSVICLASSIVPPEAERLAGQLTELSQTLGIMIDSRPFRPHITLCRKIKHPIDASLEPIEWYAKHFCLAESVASAEGSQYQVLEQWPHPTD